MADTEQTGTPTRAGFATLVGRPNVGKSTLLNAVLGQKLAIVSDLPQTTRNRILGVKTLGPTQVVLIDTPGIHRRRGQMSRFMVKEALAALDGVDCAVLVTEVARGRSGGSAELHPDDRAALEQVKAHVGAVPLVLAINKIDRLKERRALLPLMDAWQRQGIARIVPISALTGDGVQELLAEIAPLLPEGPHLYPEDMLTDRAERFLVGELIREQVFRNTRQEVPYGVAVEVETFRERADRGDVWIEAVIHVDRSSQKGILIGDKGAMIKRIGTAARAEIARLLGCPAHLKLRVHVEPHWTRSPAARRRFGYE